MPALAPFTPGKTVLITVAATTANLAIPAPRGDQVLVTSLAGNAIAYIAFGDTSVAVVAPTGTATSGIPILPGTQKVFTIPPGAVNVASIGTAGNSLYITSGDGQ